MKDCVNVKEVDSMAKRGTLLARGGVSQEDLAIQIKGIIVHVAMKDELKQDKFAEKDLSKIEKELLK